jgi:hypothetical protein
LHDRRADLVHAHRAHDQLRSLLATTFPAPRDREALAFIVYEADTHIVFRGDALADPPDMFFQTSPLRFRYREFVDGACERKIDTIEQRALARAVAPAQNRAL